MDYRTMDRGEIRKHNRLAVLKAVRDLEPISKTELSKLTGLTPATISSIVNELTELGFVGETKDTRSTGGRKAVLVELNTSDLHVVAVSIDLHGIRLGRMNMGGERIHMQYIPFEAERSEIEVLEKLTAAIRNELENEALEDETRVIGIGVVSDGLIDSDNGIWLRPRDFQFRNVRVKEVLEETFQLPVRFAHSGQGMALGEMLFGSAKGCKNFVHVHIGEKIRTGVVLNGALFPGYNFGACNVAHVRVSSRNIPCTCGSTGCFESMATHSGIVTRFIQKMEERDIGKLLEMVQYDLTGISADMVYGLAIQRDSVARQVIRDTGRYIGRGLGAIINLINPEKVFISGIYNAHSIMNREINKYLAHAAVSQNLNRVYVGETGIPDVPEIKGAAGLIVHELYDGKLLE